MKQNFRIQEKVKLNRPRTQCSEENSQAQSLKNGLGNLYINGTECQDVSGIPCMIPQAETLVTSDDRKHLQTCSSWYQYNCMLSRLFPAMKNIVTSLDQDCKLKTIHISNHKTYYLEEMANHEVISDELTHCHVSFHVHIFILS